MNNLYTAAYSRCCYNRVAESVIQTFLNDAVNNGEYDPNNLADLTLADYLEDHDDPRYHIVRRDLEHRGTNSNDYHHNVLQFQGGHYPTITYRGSEWYKIDDGQHVGIVKLYNNDTQKDLYELVTEFINKPGSLTSYRGSFHPHEAEPIIEQLRQQGFLNNRLKQ